MEKTKIQSEMANVTISGEPNKMILVGAITKINVPSTGCPCGCPEGVENVVFTEASMDENMNTFIEMPLNAEYEDGFFSEPAAFALTGHSDNDVGFIRKVWKDNDNLMAEIVVWKDKNPALAYMISNTVDSLGFSIECYPDETHIEGTTEYIDKFTGCGCALLFKKCAAWSQTFVESIAAAMKGKGDKHMNEQEKKEFVESIMAQVEEKFAGIEEKFNGIEEKVNASIKEASDKAQENLEKAIEASAKDFKDFKEASEEMKAGLEQKINELKIPAPKTKQKPVENPMMGGDAKAEFEQKKAEIEASDMTNMEKIVALTKLRREQK